jgi:hypothetical protein
MSGSGQPLRLLTWFDKRYEYLPRRVRIESASKGEPVWRALKQPGWHLSFEVTDFVRVDDPTFSRERWFPAEGAQTSLISTFRMVTDEVIINRPLPASRFAHPIEPGVRIHYEVH